MEQKPTHRPSAAAMNIGLSGHRPVNPQVLRDRLREREAREQADNRSPAEVWLGDPPPWRSALAQSKGQQTMTTTPATKATEKTAITPVPVETLSQLATVGRFTIGQKKRIARVLVDGGMNRRKVSDALGLGPSTVKKDVTAR
jgi:hypothetical protein